MKKILFLLLALTLFCPIVARDIVVHNRVLVKVNDKSITVMDLVKKMDVLFHRAYPELQNSKEARFQFYTTNWRQTLEGMIDNQLVLADAKEKKLVISDGDIRQQLEEEFGPNVVQTIDQLGLTHQEVWDMVKEDLIVQRMTMIMVHSRAFAKVTPNKIIESHEALSKSNTEPAHFVYQVFTLKAPQDKKEEALSYAHKLQECLTSLENVEEVKEKFALPPDIELSISNEVDRREEELSLSHKEVLSTLTPGSFSTPQVATSKQETILCRVFFLKEFVPTKEAKFDEMHAQLRNELLDNAIQEETKLYLSRLRKHYHLNAQVVADSSSPDFVPFSIQ